MTATKPLLILSPALFNQCLNIPAAAQRAAPKLAALREHAKHNSLGVSSAVIVEFYKNVGELAQFRKADGILTDFLRKYAISEFYIEEDAFLHNIYTCMSTDLAFGDFVELLDLSVNGRTAVSKSVAIYKLFGDIKQCTSDAEFLAVRDMRLMQIKKRMGQSKKLMAQLSKMFENLITLSKQDGSGSNVVELVLGLVAKLTGLNVKPEYKKTVAYPALLQFVEFLIKDKMLIVHLRRYPEVVLKLASADTKLLANRRESTWISLFGSSRVILAPPG